MKVDLYERIWLWLATAMLVLFVSALFVAAGAGAIHPPSHIETVNPARVRVEGPFAMPGVSTANDGTVVVTVLAEMFQFSPSVIRVPAHTPVRFRLTSPDVLHGFQVVGTNANVIVAPGYVSELTISFPTPGEYLVVCNEYCGLSHHLMQARLIVEDERER